jgi:hypothetical protein
MRIHAEPQSRRGLSRGDAEARNSSGAALFELVGAQSAPKELLEQLRETHHRNPLRGSAALREPLFRGRAA